jgi:hypothetical protein
MKQIFLVLGGAAVGGTLGYFAFFWFADQGFYGLVVPGGLLGLGAGFGRARSVPLAVACGIAALLLGLYAEWKFAPFNADDSLGYFVTHIHKLKPLTLLMAGLGGFIGFWIPFRSQPANPT